MTSRLAPIAVAAALLAAAAPAGASSGGGATAQQIEQLGPKHLLGARSCRDHPQYVALAARGARTCARVRFVTLATHSIPISERALDIEELGPKYLSH